MPSNSDSSGESFPFGMNRREYMKYFGAAGVATGLAGCGGDGGGDGNGNGNGGDNSGDQNTTTPVPEEEQRPFPLTPDATPDEWGATLSTTTDNSAGPIWSMFGPITTEDTGGAVELDAATVLPSGNYYSKLNTELIGTNDPPYDIVLNIPLYLGDFMARDVFAPLDEYIGKYDQEKMQSWLDGIIDPYKEFYMKWGGDIVALPADGDIHNLFYQHSYFHDDYHTEQYQDEYDEELTVPETWPKYNRVAKYFTENTDDGVYGAQVFGARPWNFAWWMDRAASRGVIYFDEDMEPGINSDDAVAALEHMVETMNYSPDGSSQMGVAETLQQWQQGNVVMCPWWIDLTEFTARGDFPVVGNQSSATMPGWEQDDGSIRFNAMMAYNRLFSVPAALDETTKEQAVYAILRQVTHPVLTQAVADPYTGLDPSQESHYTEEAAEYYTKANPLRETGEGFDKNVPIFSPENEPFAGDRTALEQAEQHLAAGEANLKNGFPQPNWPGASQYMEDLSIEIQRALEGQKSPQKALDDAAESWRETLESIGRENQEQVYKQNFLEPAKEFGYI